MLYHVNITEASLRKNEPSLFLAEPYLSSRSSSNPICSFMQPSLAFLRFFFYLHLHLILMNIFDHFLTFQ